MNKSILLAGICAVAAVSLPTTQASANAFTQTNTMRASANLGRIVNLAVTTNRGVTFGDFRYFNSSTNGTRYYGFMNNYPAVTKVGADSFNCSATVRTYNTHGSFEVDQTGTPQAGLIVIKGEPSYQVRIGIGGSDVNVSANTVTLRNGAATVLYRNNDPVWSYEGVGLRYANNGYDHRNFSNLNNTVWTTDADGNIALCISGSLDLPGNTDFADGTYSGTVDFTFSYE